MNPFTTKPIRFERREVALMVQIVALYVPNLPKTTGETASRIPLIAAGIIDPTPAILKFLNLQMQGDGYVWHPG
jgi:hypothetical protein